MCGCELRCLIDMHYKGLTVLGCAGCCGCSSDEAARPENADLKDIIAKVKEAKAKIDAGDKVNSLYYSLGAPVHQPPSWGTMGRVERAAELSTTWLSDDLQSLSSYLAHAGGLVECKN